MLDTEKLLQKVKAFLDNKVTKSLSITCQDYYDRVLIRDLLLSQNLNLKNLNNRILSNETKTKFFILDIASENKPIIFS